MQLSISALVWTWRLCLERRNLSLRKCEDCQHSLWISFCRFCFGNLHVGLKNARRAWSWITHPDSWNFIWFCSFTRRTQRRFLNHSRSYVQGQKNSLQAVGMWFRVHIWVSGSQRLRGLAELIREHSQESLRWFTAADYYWWFMSINQTSNIYPRILTIPNSPPRKWKGRNNKINENRSGVSSALCQEQAWVWTRRSYREWQQQQI